MTRVEITRAADDPLALRASIGGGKVAGDAFYLVYRGDPAAVLDMLRAVLAAAEGVLGAAPRRPQG